MGNFFNDPVFTLQNLVVGAAGSLLAAAITYFLAVVLHLRLPSPSSVLFWRRFTTNLRIVTSEIRAEQDPNRPKGRHFALAPIGEALSLAELFSYFRNSLRCTPQFVSVQSQQDFDQVKSHNLLIVGGPKFNHAAKCFLSDIDSKLDFQFQRLRDESPKVGPSDKDLEFSKKRLVSRSDKAGSFDLSPDGKQEYGMLVICRSPYNRNKFVVCLSGLNQMSTLAATIAFLRLRGFTLVKFLLLHSGLQAIVSCQVTDNVAVTNVSVVALCPIDESTK